MKKIFVAVVAAMVCTAAMAQDAGQDAGQEVQQEKSFFQKFKDWRIRSIESKCDTNYLMITKYAWCAKVSNVSEFNTYKYNLGGGDRIEGKSGYNNRTIVALFWRGLGVAWSFGMNKNIDRNFSLGLNGNKIGGNFNWQQNTQDIGTGTPANFNHLDLNVYYVFNPRKFSINAVTRQHTFIQKKSAGSFYLTADFNRTVVKNMVTDFDIVMQPVHQFRASLGVGYGYNLSFQQGKFLLHASYAPNVNLLNVIRQYDANDENGQTISSGMGLAYGHNATVGGSYDIKQRVVLGFLASDRFSLSDDNIPYSISYNYCGVEGFVRVRF